MRAHRGALAVVTGIASAVVVASSAAAPTLPPPQFGRSIDIGLVTGTVIVHPAHGTAFRLGLADRSIPVGSELDTTHGEVDLRSARPPAHGAVSASPPAPVQDAQFSKGIFAVLQRTSQRGLTVIQLMTPVTTVRSVCSAATASTRASHLSQRVISTLHATDTGGRFRTRGRYSAGTVRGTSWDTTDRCDGTLTTVHRGTVNVFNFVTRRTVEVDAGHSYLAGPSGAEVPPVGP